MVGEPAEPQHKFLKAKLIAKIMPRNAGFVLRIDPNTDAATTISTVTGTDKYVGGVLAPNGKIYCMPITLEDGNVND